LKPGEDNRQSPSHAWHLMPEVHLKDYIGVVLQHLKLVVVVVVICFVLGGLKVWSTKPEYRAAALVRVCAGRGDRLADDWASGYASYLNREKDLTTYCQIIQSWDFSRNLVASHGVASHKHLGLSQPSPGLLGRAKQWITGHVPTSEGGAANAQDDKARILGFAALVQGRIRADVMEDTNLIEVSYTAEDAEGAARVCQWVTEMFIRGEWDRRMRSADRWLEWFRNQQAEFEKKVAASEKELLDFHKSEQAYMVGEGAAGDRAAVLQSTIETLRARHAQVRLKRIELATRLQMLEQLPQGGEGSASNLSMLDDPLADQLVQKRGELRRDLAVKRVRYGPKHPEIEAGAKELALLDEDIKSRAEEAVSTVRKRLQGAELEEEKLIAEIDKAETKAADINKQLIAYNALKRKADANKRFFDTIITKAKEADLAASIESINIDLVTDEPHVTQAPGTGMRTMVLALFLGLIMGVGLALFLDYMDTTLSTPFDVQRSIEVGQLAVLVHSGPKKRGKEEPLLVAQTEPQGQLTEDFRSLRAAVLLSPEFRDVHFFVVTSSTAREGKSTVATNLAVVLAQAGKKVLLVDGDMRKPAVHKVLGGERQPGLSDFLQGKCEFEGLAQSHEVAGLSVIPCGSPIQKPAELIGSASARFTELVERSEQFDYVLFDTPPLTLSDPTLLANAVGGVVLLVIRAGQVSRDVVRQSLENLRSVAANVGGVILNDFDLRKQRYAYGARYYGYYGYYHHYYEETEGDKKKAKKKDRKSS